MPKKNSVYEHLLLPFLALFSPRFASGPNSTVGTLATDVIPGDGEVGAGVCTKKINNTSSAVPAAYRDLNDHILYNLSKKPKAYDYWRTTKTKEIL